MFNKNILLGLLFLLPATSIYSKTAVAIIDSGVDYKHEMFSDYMWKNLLEIPDNNRDEDGNGYQDDVYGWNFAEDNPFIIDYKYLGTFSDNPRTFFEIQGRSFQGKTTQADKDWVNEKRQDPNFMAEMQIFGNFVHGTHVAGIASGSDPEIEIMGVKLLPTEVKLPKMPKRDKKDDLSDKKPRKVNDKLMRAALKMLANAQTESMKNIAVYLDGHNIPVANGSFGTGYNQAKMIVTMISKVLTFGRGTDEATIDKYAKVAVQEMAIAGADFVSLAPHTLFVFAAGNDGLNNDTFGTSPANISADNVITVGATFDNLALAPFSNYGQKVHVAAPGVIIKSAIPGNEYLQVSGTSQAAPYVARLAAQIKNVNPKLTPKEIKEILMRTVTKAEFLNGKILTAGFVNDERAIVAAELSLNMDLEIAINQVEDKNYIKTPQIVFPDDGLMLMPMTGQFKLPTK